MCLGVPKKIISKKKLETVLQFAPPLEHAAAYLDVSIEDLRQACDHHFGVSYNQLKLKHRTMIGNMLLAHAIDRATKGGSDQLLRLLLGHFADVFEKQKVEIQTPVVQLAYSLEPSPQPALKDVGPDAVIDT